MTIKYQKVQNSHMQLCTINIDSYNILILMNIKYKLLFNDHLTYIEIEIIVLFFNDF